MPIIELTKEQLDIVIGHSYDAIIRQEKMMVKTCSLVFKQDYADRETVELLLELMEIAIRTKSLLIYLWTKHSIEVTAEKEICELKSSICSINESRAVIIEKLDIDLMLD